MANPITYTLELQDQYLQPFGGIVDMEYQIFQEQTEEEIYAYLSIITQDNNGCAIQFDENGFESEYPGGTILPKTFKIKASDKISEVPGIAQFLVKYN